MLKVASLTNSPKCNHDKKNIVNHPLYWLSIWLLLEPRFEEWLDRKNLGSNSDMTVYHFPVKPKHILPTSLASPPRL